MQPGTVSPVECGGSCRVQSGTAVPRGIPASLLLHLEGKPCVEATLSAQAALTTTNGRGNEELSRLVTKMEKSIVWTQLDLGALG
jgi:hypothetical protein